MVNLLGALPWCILVFILFASRLSLSDALFRRARWNFQKRLEASDRRAGDRFGRAVAISGNTIVVGAYWDEIDDMSLAGSVYVFTSTLFGGWHQREKLVSDFPSTNDNFGGSVAVYGERVVVGVQQRDAIAGEDVGIAYVFDGDRRNRRWVQQTRLEPSTGENDDNFGRSLAIYKDTIVVGSLFHDFGDETTLRNSGAAYVYEWTGTEWDEVILSASDQEPEDFFGESVSISNQTIVVGARGRAGVGANDTGAVYVFQQNIESGEWTEEAILTPMDPIENHGFGAAVAIDGDNIIVGATRDEEMVATGAAYVFSRNGDGTWSEQAKLLAEDGDEGDQFGVSVAINGEVVVVGAYLDNQFEQENVGAAYVFRRTQEGAWEEEQKLSACDKSGGDSYGLSVAISDDVVVVGAAGSDRRRRGEDSGAVYVYKYNKRSRIVRKGRCAMKGE